jgi:hypothetical protein
MRADNTTLSELPDDRRGDAVLDGVVEGDDLWQTVPPP